MKIRHYRNIAVALALSLCVSNVLTAKTLNTVALPQTTETSTAKVIRLLQESGYVSRKTGDHTWVIERPGKNKGKGWILAATGREFVVLGIIVAEKKNMRPSADLYLTLLKFNHSQDYIKVGLDDDDDLFVRTELRIGLVDLRAFITMIQDVDSGADKLNEVVRPFLITP